ncbi:hypothetical protein [Laribacter hongkongensis]|uniref:hypothetical protein n=1 Tax=Laribacter hongkongensis TaxID=168471 RepID=UPI001EFD68F9|nr:hypothetical protein [Laribacter hongkongensis]MCG9097846.1 hypothetical protein [Laribacter hongkongensis]
MTATADLLNAIDKLRTHATQFIDESFRLILEGEALGGSVSADIQQVISLAAELGIEIPTLIISDLPASAADLADAAYDDEPWRLIFGKRQLAERMRTRDDEATLLFFTVEGFHHWLTSADPFLYPMGNEPDLAKPTTVRVHGLQEGFGGPLLWVLPSEGDAPEVVAAKLPDLSEVHGLIHTNAVKPLRVCPAAYALTWGNLTSAEAAPLIRLSARVLSACLVQELRLVGDQYEVTLRGTKRLSLPLFDDEQTVTCETLHGLIEAVRWVYEERPETRLRLIMDRLSIDIEPSLSLLSGVDKYLAAALQQARDSYAFVILERKDAYHKEVRELMKDMKSQADLYAAKVRDLVSSLTRDVLGILVFIGFSFIGKFDQKNLQVLLKSAELALLVKVLAGYLVLSFVLQLSSQWRDAKLAFDESKTWLDVLQHYSSQADKRDRFLKPIGKRRQTLFVAMWIIAAIYGALVLVTWNLPFIVELLLAQ